MFFAGPFQVNTEAFTGYQEPNWMEVRFVLEKKEKKKIFLKKGLQDCIYSYIFASWDQTTILQFYNHGKHTELHFCEMSSKKSLWAFTCYSYSINHQLANR